MKCHRLLLSIVFTCVLGLNSHNAWAATSIFGCTRLTHPGSFVLKNNITATATTMTSTWIGGYTGENRMISRTPSIRKSAASTNVSDATPSSGCMMRYAPKKT